MHVLFPCLVTSVSEIFVSLYLLISLHIFLTNLYCENMFLGMLPMGILQSPKWRWIIPGMNFICFCSVFGGATRMVTVWSKFLVWGFVGYPCSVDSGSELMWRLGCGLNIWGFVFNFFHCWDSRKATFLQSPGKQFFFLIHPFSKSIILWVSNFMSWVHSWMSLNLIFSVLSLARIWKPVVNFNRFNYCPKVKRWRQGSTYIHLVFGLKYSNNYSLFCSSIIFRFINI